MAETVEDLTFDYEDEGQLVRKELKKEVLTKGAWATLMFLYQELDRRTGEYRDPKISIVRFKKSSGVYRKQSSFNISSEKQARQIVSVIEKWYGAGGANDVVSEPEYVAEEEEGTTTQTNSAPTVETPSVSTDGEY
ncbi:MAG: hypothetical protein V1754_11885 [Pseudomonadota bacterium]